MNNKETLIPFRASDSELGGFEYTIPEGYEAEIKGGKVVVRKTDEKIRKNIIALIKQSSEILTLKNQQSMIAWLEKQGGQKPVVSKFKVGDTIWKKTDHTNRITISMVDKYYYCANSYYVLIDIADKEWELVEQKPIIAVPCDDCINRKGCINCENGELKETEQKGVNPETQKTTIEPKPCKVSYIDVSNEPEAKAIAVIDKLEKWFDGLSDEEKEAFAKENPDLVKRVSQKPKDELTEFELKLQAVMLQVKSGLIDPKDISVVKEWSDIMLIMARKQIASEINATQMTREIRIKEFISLALGAAYYQGIVNTIKKIKGENV